MYPGTPAWFYVKRVYATWPINPLDPRTVIAFDNVMVGVRPGFEADEVDLSSLFTMDAPGKGWASKVLDWLLDLADEMHVRLTGVITPFGRERRFTAEQIWEWEKRHGFVVDRRERYLLQSPTRGQGRRVIYYPGSRTKSNLSGWCQCGI